MLFGAGACLQDRRLGVLGSMQFGVLFEVLVTVRADVCEILFRGAVRVQSSACFLLSGVYAGVISVFVFLVVVFACCSISAVFAKCS